MKEKTILTREEWEETQAIIQEGKRKQQEREKEQKKVKTRLKLKRNVKNGIILLSSSALLLVLYHLIAEQPLFWFCFVPLVTIIILSIED